MLDEALKAQISELFKKIELSTKIELNMKESSHSEQKDLLELLIEISSLSDNISLINSNEQSLVPSFSIKKNGIENGVSFRGLPLGHEFSSFILAILNAADLGKKPDDSFIDRIKFLKGKKKISTYISLNCENCPDVVQALSLIANLHGSISHEMVDGAFAQEEVSQLGIHGVPSVFIDGKLFHSGKSSLAELLEKLEKELGTSISSEPSYLGHYDVLVIGGGPAGVSSAIYTARKGVKTAIVSGNIGGQTLETKGIENFISVLATEGKILSSNLYEHIKSYDIALFENRFVKEVITEENRKVVTLSNGDTISTESIIIATGAKWRELNIPGEKEYKGRGVAYCPHCDGPYYKDKQVAVIGGGNSGVEAAIDLSGICSKVTLFEYSNDLKADKVLVDKLKSLPNVTVLTSVSTKAIEGDGQKLNKLFYESLESKEIKELALDGIFVQIGLSPNSNAFKELVDLNERGEIIVDFKGRTSNSGIYAAGDVTTSPFKQIIIAMGDGAKASLSLFEDKMRH